MSDTKQKDYSKHSRVGWEKDTVAFMIGLYCRKKEKNPSLCSSCEELMQYAHTRLDRCPLEEEKSTCEKCTVHCYKPAMRERMREVMRFAGPRMLWYAPLHTIRHLFYALVKTN